MELLNYDVLKKTDYNGYILENAPEKVIQFGEGNFLRAFVDYWFDMSNEKAGWNGKCVLVQPIELGLAKEINKQQGLYTLYLRGREQGKEVNDKRVISSVSRCLNPYEKEDFDKLMELAVSDDVEYIVSNTTEAGIVYDSTCKLEDCPPKSFPAKLTQLLYERYKAGKKALVILSCELIDNNGKELLKCVKKHIAKWGLEDGFDKWIDTCTFCSTLVDRIVPGRIRDKEELEKLNEQNGYADQLIDVGEVFGVWNIEGPKWLEDQLPFKAAGLNCPVVEDVTPYKKRKVRILNGAHTGFVLGSYLSGFDIVRDCMQDKVISKFMNKMLNEEIIPTLPLDRKDLDDFAAAVEDRFNNPFIDHQLLSISLNSTSKWRARNFPSLDEYVKLKGKLPCCLTTSFAEYIAFYSQNIEKITENGMICVRNNNGKTNEYTVSDDSWVLEFYFAHKDDDDETLVESVMKNREMWGQDLTQIEGFKDEVVSVLKLIRKEGSYEAMKQATEKEE